MSTTTALTPGFCPCGGIYFVRRLRIGGTVQVCHECERCRAWVRADR